MMGSRARHDYSNSEIELTNIDSRIEEMLDGLSEDQRGAVRQIQDTMRAADRRYEMTLAMIRNAAQKTQADLARELHVTQGAVARQEARSDMLLSTLRSHLEAVGADMSITVHLASGETCELSLAAV